MAIKHWIEASRPKTLPLSFSPVIAGSCIAFSEATFSVSVFVLTLLTTLLLQVLSNFANDYGDYKKGTDALNRLGPKRMVQSGAISEHQMKRAVIVTSLLTLASGISLLIISTNSIQDLVFWFVTGIAAITAAITYTVGKRAYGYSGFGDVFVFIFFGIVGVFGTYYLQTSLLNYNVLLIATAIGVLATGVLNINNIRDYENDKKANKKTIVVYMGLDSAKTYHISLLITAIVVTLIFSYLHNLSLYQYLFLFSIIPLTKHIKAVYSYKKPEELNNQLKVLSLSTFLFSLLFGIGVVL